MGADDYHTIRRRDCVEGPHGVNAPLDKRNPANSIRIHNSRKIKFENNP
jgi:hypothetical protein